MKSDLPSAKPRAGTEPAAKVARLAREAAALRANLRKRKDQMRERAESAETAPKQG
jgi:hypothetical protein